MHQLCAKNKAEILLDFFTCFLILLQKLKLTKIFFIPYYIIIIVNWLFSIIICLTPHPGAICFGRPYQGATKAPQQYSIWYHSRNSDTNKLMWALTQTRKACSSWFAGYVDKWQCGDWSVLATCLGLCVWLLGVGIAVVGVHALLTSGGTLTLSSIPPLGFLGF